MDALVSEPRKRQRCYRDRLSCNHVRRNREGLLQEKGRTQRAQHRYPHIYGWEKARKHQSQRNCLFRRPGRETHRRIQCHGRTEDVRRCRPEGRDDCQDRLQTGEDPLQDVAILSDRSSMRLFVGSRILDAIVLWTSSNEEMSTAVSAL